MASFPLTATAAFNVRLLAAVENAVPAVPIDPVVDTAAILAAFKVTPAAVCNAVPAVLAACTK